MTKLLKTALVALVAILLPLAGFYLGVRYQQNQPADTQNCPSSSSQAGMVTDAQVVNYLETCQVKTITSTHRNGTAITLKNGKSLKLSEDKTDFRPVIARAQPRCGEIIYLME